MTRSGFYCLGISYKFYWFGLPLGYIFQRNVKWVNFPGFLNPHYLPGCGRVSRVSRAF